MNCELCEWKANEIVYRLVKTTFFLFGMDKQIHIEEAIHCIIDIVNAECSILDFSH
jgi:hypothetical protein